MLSGSRGDSTTGCLATSCPISRTEAGLKPGSSQEPHYLSWPAEGDVWSFVPEPLVFYRTEWSCFCPHGSWSQSALSDVGVLWMVPQEDTQPVRECHATPTSGLCFWELQQVLLGAGELPQGLGSGAPSWDAGRTIYFTIECFYMFNKQSQSYELIFHKSASNTASFCWSICQGILRCILMNTTDRAWNIVTLIFAYNLFNVYSYKKFNQSFENKTYPLLIILLGFLASLMHLIVLAWT